MAAPTIQEFVSITVSVSDALAAKFSFGTPLGAFAHTVNANRVNGPYTSITAVTAAGFTAVAEPEVFGWASSMFNQGLGVDQVKIGLQTVADAGDFTVTLPAILAADADWYGLNIESRAEADINATAAFIEPLGTGATPKIFVAQSSDAALLAGAAGNIGEDLRLQGYNRTALIYHALDDAAAGTDESDGYLDAAWMSRCLGFNLDGVNGRGQWIFKQLTGVPFDEFTDPQAQAIYAENANLYGSTASLAFPSKGTMASGRFMDITTSVDWLKKRFEEEIISALVADPVGIDLTTAGIGKLNSATSRVAARGVLFGHFSPDFDNVVTWPSVNQLSAADRTNRIISASGVMYLAGGVVKVNLTINVVP